MTATAAPTRTMLTALDAANELGVSELAIKRQFARGRLAATPLPNNAGLRIAPAAFTTFVSAGLADLPVPDLDATSQMAATGWFDNPGDEWRANEAFNALRAVIPVPTRDEVQRLAEAAKNSTLTRTIGVPSAALAVMARSIPATSVSPSRFATAGDAFLANMLRNQVRGLIQVDEKLRREPMLAALYKSPTVYADLIKRASDNVRESIVSTTHIEHAMALSWSTMPVTVTLNQGFRIRDLAPESTLRRVAAAAF